MAGENIERFGIVTSKVLEALAATFPKPINLSAEPLGLQTSTRGEWGDDGDYREGEPLTDDEEVLEASIRWLIQEDYIFSWSSDSRALVLTHKGLTLAKCFPAILTD